MLCTPGPGSAVETRVAATPRRPPYRCFFRELRTFGTLYWLISGVPRAMVSDRTVQVAGDRELPFTVRAATRRGGRSAARAQSRCPPRRQRRELARAVLTSNRRAGSCLRDATSKHTEGECRIAVTVRSAFSFTEAHLAPERASHRRPRTRRCLTPASRAGASGSTGARLHWALAVPGGSHLRACERF